MSDADRFQAAIAADVLAASSARAALLQSIVEVARAIFVARAASIALLDEGAGDFVFEAVAGEGAGRLVGTRFPAGQGIAGTVAQTGEPMIIDDLSQDPRFARDLAADTGYVPRAMMVAPLLSGERTLGVLSVLDRGPSGRSTLQELDLLVHFAGQAALALDAGEAARRAAALLEEGADDELGAVATLARRVAGLSGERREAGLALLKALGTLLA
jgi:GAF domain-containing protein